MKELLEVFKESSPMMLVLLAAAYFLKTALEKFMEKKMEVMAHRIEAIDDASLKIKADMRGNESGDLVDFRVAVEKWEYFLQSSIGDYSMQPATATDSIPKLYAKDNKLFLDVRVSLVKACIYLRDEKLENQLTKTILAIRRLYYPLISQGLEPMIGTQTKLATLQNKLDRFRDSGMKDMTSAPTQEDLENSRKWQAELTAETKAFADNLIKQYPPIAEQLVELKMQINHYIYRPFTNAAVDVK